MCVCSVLYGVLILVMKVSSCLLVGRNSSVGIATSYGPDGPGIKFRWKRDFPHSTRPALGPIQPFIKWVPPLFPGVKRPGRGFHHPPHLASSLKNG